ncbi:DUF2767 family protein [Salmonella enterica]|uniref:Fumarase D n=1 Tax=Salmonella enterica TaxID=28901 RepID=A0A760I2F0_SALER|nr:DUF2767 family protein [Salmonella enterica]HAG2365066.1 DUF2767 family protein [Salmonella enterica]
MKNEELAQLRYQEMCRIVGEAAGRVGQRKPGAVAGLAETVNLVYLI